MLHHQTYYRWSFCDYTSESGWEIAGVLRFLLTSYCCFCSHFHSHVDCRTAYTICRDVCELLHHFYHTALSFRINRFDWGRKTSCYSSIHHSRLCSHLLDKKTSLCQLGYICVFLRKILFTFHTHHLLQSLRPIVLYSDYLFNFLCYNLTLWKPP